jgi:hypothetical protein
VTLRQLLTTTAGAAALALLAIVAGSRFAGTSDAQTIGVLDATPAVFGGRLTLTSGVPVMALSATSATTFYYTPYPGAPGGARISIPTGNGTKTLNYQLAELSNVTTNAATGNAGPAAVAASSVYDAYVWSNAGVLTLTRSPAWTSATARGSGAGTAQLDCITIPGMCTNAVAITNGPAANRGTWLGTVASDVGSTIDYQFGSSAAGGVQAIFNVWNQYNRLPVGTFVGDSTASWTYTTAAFRAADNSANMRMTFVRGANEDAVQATYGTENGGSVAGDRCSVAIGLDSTSAFAGRVGSGQVVTGTVAARIQLASEYVGQPGLGSHFLSALEYGATTCTFLGFSSGLVQYGFQATLRQ